MSLAEKDRDAVRERLTNELHSSVALEVFTKETSSNPDDPSSEMRRRALRELVDDVVSLSPHLRVTHHAWERSLERARELGVARPAAIAFVAPGVQGRMVQYGTPAGYGFRSFLSGIVEASLLGRDAIDDIARGLVADLPEDIHLQIFTMPGCPHCPKMARVAYQLAAGFDRFSVDVIDSTEFKDLARQYGVEGVPLSVVNETVEVVGAMQAQAFLKRLAREHVPPRRRAAS